jgi:tetratricopeptide (TPR) repeat protein
MQMPTTTPPVHADDLYERLGIERNASREEVRAAYRALLRQYPPERAPEEFKRIREAYETLNDAGSRAEYDRAPSAAVQRLLRLASAAMDARGYPEAEVHLKAVLDEDPTLDYARNWLGLCLLYQKKPGEALELYHLLLRRAEPAPAWFGNAGHACAGLGRFPAAEEMFRRAIEAADAAGEEVTSYYVALADLHVTRKDLNAAEEVLEKAIRHDGEVDFEDLQYFTKLLEVQLRRNDAQRVGTVLRRIKVVAADPGQREYTAWKLASLAAQLLEAGAFPLACPVGRAAAELMPGEADYQALVQMASLLNQNLPAEAEQMLRTHRCFFDGGWLAGMNAALRKHCSELRVFGTMKPISSAPPLFTINGLGTRLYGERDFDPHTRSYVTTLYFVVLYLPFIPLGCYRVIADGDRSYRFLGKVPFSKWNRRHLAAALALIFMMGMGVAASAMYSADPYASGWQGASSPGTGYAMPATVDTGAAISAFTGTPGGGSEPPALSSERARILRSEAQLRRMQAQADSTDAQIEELAGRIGEMERNAPAGGMPFERYESYQGLIRRHNALVEEQNERRERFNRRYTEYQTARAEFNRRIDEYNASH